MNDIKYQRIIQAVTETPWAIMPEKLAVIRQVLALRASGGQLTPEEIRTQLEAVQSGPRVASSGGATIAFIPVVGSLIPRGNLMLETSGAVSVERLTRQFRAAVNDPEVSSILLDIDSPGGQVGGIEELSSEIYDARGKKPIIAVANGLAASAAYWMGSAADELVISPSGEVGSIGVFAIHEDISTALERSGVDVTLISAGRYKTEGNPFQPLSEEAQDAAQNRVNEFYEMFIGAVARNRGVSQSDVMDGFGQGRVVGADQAVSLGMADRVDTIDMVISGLVSGGREREQARAEALEYRTRRLRAFSRV